MSRLSLPVIAGVSLVAILSSSSVVKAEPDYPCYIQNSAGQTVDLSRMCKGRVLESAAAPQSISQQSPSLDEEGKVVLASRISFQEDPGSPFWFVLGRVRNDTNQTVSEIKVTLSVDGKLTTASMPSSKLKPGEIGTFQALFADRKSPSIAVIDTVAWKREDGSLASYKGISLSAGQ